MISVIELYVRRFIRIRTLNESKLNFAANEKTKCINILRDIDLSWIVTPKNVCHLHHNWNFFESGSLALIFGKIWPTSGTEKIKCKF